MGRLQRAHQLVISVVVIVLPVVSVTSIAADKSRLGDPLERLVTQPTEWREYDWNPANKSKLIANSRWVQNTEQFVEKNGTLVTHERQLEALGATWSAQLWRTLNPESDVQITIKRDVPAEECAQAALAIGRALGSPIVSDSSTRVYFGKDNYVETVSQEWQWTVGKTRIGAYCYGALASAESGGKSNSIVVSYAPIARKEPLKPSFSLRCTRESEYSGSWSALNDLSISVSQNPPMVRDKLMVPLDHEPPLIDQYSIAFALKTQDLVIRYVIDRMTGSLRGEAKAPYGRTAGTIRGKCDKTESVTRF